ncbi:MAG: hypothetical protein OHK0046_47400 [Anaerolineae bacterium]
MHIDWQTSEVRTRSVRGKPRRERYYAVTCDCGSVRWLRRTDAERAGQCFHCAQIAKAPLGWKATAKKYGADFGIKAVREWRLENPSDLEQWFMRVAEEMRLTYQREVLLADRWLIDFVIENVAYEVDGYWHQYRDDSAKHEAARAAGYELVILEESDLLDLLSILEAHHGVQPDRRTA